jgi:arylsulfatase A-like enzyme
MKRYPNIVFILSDDHGVWANGCYGNREIKTPNIDRLAENGVRFENFFCVSPVCSPARASIMTGRIPSQHGIHDYLCDGNGFKGQTSIEYLKDQPGYTDILKENGYECALSGKWHMGDSFNPQKGFSFWYAHQKGGGPYYKAPMVRDGKPFIEERYITDVITDEALHFLDIRDKNAPFYLSIHYTAPHSPWVGCHPKEYVGMYDDCPFESCPQGKPHPWALTDIMPGYTNSRENLKGYFAAVTAMDFNIGRVLDRLKAEGIEEDTLVIYMSDNGFNCGHHGIWGKGNGTFPLNMYDTSVKVPFIVSHPSVLPKGVVSDIMVSAYDFMPTLLDYLGIENKDSEKLPGRSFLPALRGEEIKEQPIMVFDEYGPVRMIRTRDYKYVHRYAYGPNELYFLKDDPGEEKNLIDDPQYQDIVGGLKRRMDLWFNKYVDPKINGAMEPVLGGGQKNLAGLNGPGFDVYRENKFV